MLKNFAAVCLMVLCTTSCDQVQRAVGQQRQALSTGGAYILLEVDRAALIQGQLPSLSLEMADALRAATPSIRYDGRGTMGDAARIRLVDQADAPRALGTLSTLRGSGVDLKSSADGLIEARLSDVGAAQAVNAGIDRTAAILQRRLNRLDALVERRGQRLLVHAGPRVPDPTQLIAMTRIALVTFHMVRELDAQAVQQGQLPPRTMLAQPYAGIGAYAEVVDADAELTGASISNATVGMSADGVPNVAFELSPEGAREFCQITRRHLNTRFAVLIDKQVLTAPMIQEPICEGHGQITGNFTPETAYELASYIREGALPAPIAVVQQGVGEYGS